MESGTPRYPRLFDVMSLKAVGSPAYLDAETARARYEAGNSIHVVPDGTTPAWLLVVAPERFRFSVTSYSVTGTPLRDATWELDDGSLLCRRIIDLFYPQGDPCRRVPFVGVTSVTHDIDRDGVVRSTLSAPQEHGVAHEGAVDPHAVRTQVPAFGDWDRVVGAAAPGTSARFGVDAIDAAIAAAATHTH